MGGDDRVARMQADGDADHPRAHRRPARRRLASASSAPSAARCASRTASTPGDGKIGGEGTIDGRPVAIVGDDITVKRGSSSIVGSRRIARLYERALERGTPFVYVGETGGGRIPDLIGAEGISDVAPSSTWPAVAGGVPMATVIVGPELRRLVVPSGLLRLRGAGPRLGAWR